MKQVSLKNIYGDYKGVLGNILVMEGLITEEQLTDALKEAQEDELIGDVIIRLGFASETDILHTIRNNQRIPAVNLDDFPIAHGLAKLFSHEFCKKNVLVPLKLDRKVLTIAMADPTDIIKLDDISMFTGLRVEPVVSTSTDIQKHIAVLFDGNDRAAGDDQEDITAYDDVQNVDEMVKEETIEEFDVLMEEEEARINLQELVNSSGIPPIVKIVNTTILEALRNRASDIHIEPKTKYTIVRFRIDGMLQTKIKIPLSLHAAVISRIKILAKLDISERRKPQDGRITITTGKRTVDVRVSTLPTLSGEKVVMRILDKNASIKKLAELGMLKTDLDRLELVIKKPQGIFISTGPTGSGKTTMLYSILSEMMNASRNFETIEDPVEYFLEDANQVAVREHIGLSFASVLRATLRQDPDVVLVGEIRDQETADAAFKAALTGHMVLTTLHTNSTIASITRLIDMKVQPYLIASAIEGIIAQRLVRKICPHCKTGIVPDDEALNLLKVPEGTLKEVFVGKGCKHCNNTGYLGRVGVFEVFTINDELRHMITGDYRESEMLNLAKAGGMRTLMEDGLEKVKTGITTLDEILRVLGPPIRYERQCEGCGKRVDVKFPYCPYCGKFKENVCRVCKAPLENEWNHCPYCGTNKEGQERVDKQFALLSNG